MKIILNTSGLNISTHYIETLVLLYMPCEKFGLDADMPRLVINAEQNGEQLFCSIELFAENGIYKKQRHSVKSNYPNGIDHAKCFVGATFISLFSELYGYAPPWGIMTGVRPAGYAAQLKRKGLSFDEIKAVFVNCFMVSQKKAELACLLAEQIEKSPKGKYSLYVGIPFCPTRCRYCSFVSYSSEGLMALIPDYIKMLKNEITSLTATARELGLSLSEVYIGGGTPSILIKEQLEELLLCIRQADSGEYEFSFEGGRPDTIDAEKLDVLKKYGVLRVCINTQTTNDSILKSVGRSHTYEQYKKAFYLARERDFVINTDLIAGLPGESLESFKKSVDDIKSLSPQNITVHAFSLKKSSEYTVSGQRLEQFSSDIEAMLDYSQSTLTGGGYIPYYMYRQKNTQGNFENVGYSDSPKSICRYNITMMEGTHSVFAAGAGASTKLVSDDCLKTEKIYNAKYPYEYLGGFLDIHSKEQQIKDFFEKNN